MNFLADENVPIPSIALLRGEDHDVAAVIEVSRGAPDYDILQHAVDEHRILLTFDRDYGELVFGHGHQAPPGVVYFRFFPRSPTEPATVLLRLLADDTTELTNMFTVVSPGIVRQ